MTRPPALRADAAATRDWSASSMRRSRTIPSRSPSRTSMCEAKTTSPLGSSSVTLPEAVTRSARRLYETMSARSTRSFCATSTLPRAVTTSRSWS